MDIGNQSSYQGYPVEHCWAPITPGNTVLSDPKINSENGLENRFNKKINYWEGNLGRESGVLDMNGGVYDGYLMGNLWNGLPCSHLLALADASTTTKGPGGACGGSGGGGGIDGGGGGGDIEVNMRFGNQNSGSGFISNSQPYKQPDRPRFLFDLNSPPILTEPQIFTTISSHLTPVAPTPTKRPVHKKALSDIINSNTDQQTDQATEKQDKETFNLKKPEVIIDQSHDAIWQVDVNEDFEDESSDEYNLKKTPQPKQRRRKHRPKVVIEGQPKTAKKSTTPKTPSTGKRKYVRKTPKTDEKSEENVQKTRNSCRRKIDFDEDWDYHMEVRSFGQLSPITPNKPEIKHDINNSSRAKRNINFSRETYDSNCSTSNTNNKSLEGYIHFPTIYKKKRTKKLRFKTPETSWNLYKNNISSLGHFDSLRKKRTKGVKRVRDLATLTEIIEHKQKSTYITCMEALMDFNTNILTKKRTKRNSIVSSSYHNLLNEDYYPYFRWKRMYDVNSLVTQFENLGLNDLTVENDRDRYAVVPYFTRYREKNALVLYKQRRNENRNRNIVPFEESYDVLRKKNMRPKVDIDDETDRVWRLLLEDINSEGIDGIEEDKTKWWEEERNVFRGRAVSFIARMHLIQGDRRFSKWKGSVVDSVIGVFLTQNVSDHLSSSAFMNLAARYPSKSTIINEPLQEEKSSICVKEPCHIDLEESINWHEENSNLQEAVRSNKSGSEVLEVSRNNSGIIASFTEENKGVDDVLSSQNSNESISDNHGSKVLEAEYFEVREDITNCGSEESGISAEIPEASGSNNIVENLRETVDNIVEDGNIEKMASVMELKKGKSGKAKKFKVYWDSLRTSARIKCKRERTRDTMDSVDYETVRCADVNEIADTIKDRGMNNMLAERIKEFLNRLLKDHGSMDLEWLRDVPPDKAKEYLLSFRGLGLKSVECVRLLTLHHLAFPVDTNVGRIAVRLGWVPLQPLPESLQLHLLELYPVLETIQKYLWPRLCKLDQPTLYELHYQMITFGKVFCTKSKPNCNACPMRGECRHFASAFASARLSLPAPGEKSIITATKNKPFGQGQGQGQSQSQNPSDQHHHLTLLPPHHDLHQESEFRNRDPVIEEPTTPEPEKVEEENDIEDYFGEEDEEEIPIIKLNMEAFTQNLQNYMENNMEIEKGEMSKALVALTSEAANIPPPKLKNVSQLRTEHQVYELPDTHPLLEGLDKREPDDPCSYLLAIWTPGETAESIQPPGGQCSSQESFGTLCKKETCFLCNSIREANSQTVRGTLLIPCRTAMRGSFPLNGTYFQVNEVFADHDSSLSPIDVPRSWLWNLPRRTVYFGTSIPTIFKGLTTEGIQYCFWRGFVCVRGFDQKTRAPRPLMARLHFPASKLKRSKWKEEED